MNEYKIAIIGLGYVGLPLARLFATKYAVIGFDINKKRISELNSGTDTTLEVDDKTLQSVLINENSELVLSIDLEALKVHVGEYSFDCSIKEDARKSLLDGSFDSLNELLEANSEVDSIVTKLEYMNG